MASKSDSAPPFRRRKFHGEATTTFRVIFQVGIYGSVSKPWHLVNPKIAGKWMFIPLELIIIGIDPYPYIGYLRPLSMGGFFLMLSV